MTDYQRLYAEYHAVNNTLQALLVAIMPVDDAVFARFEAEMKKYVHAGEQVAKIAPIHSPEAADIELAYTQKFRGIMNKARAAHEKK